MTIAEAVTAFLQSRRTRNCRTGTIKTYSRVLGFFVDYLRRIGVTTTDFLSIAVIENYLSERQNIGRQASTVKNERGVVVMFCRYLTKIKVMPFENWNDVCQIRVDDKPPSTIKQGLCAELVDTIDHILFYRDPLLRKRDKAVFSVLYDTGIRAGELLRLDISDLDLQRSTIYISELGKSRRARVVLITDTTVKYLKAYLTVREKHAKKTDALFVTRYGRRMNYSGLHWFISRIGRICGEHITPHKIRHTNVSVLANSGMPLGDVQRLSGHAHITTTMKYVHPDDEQIRRRYMEVAPMDRLTGEQA